MNNTGHALIPTALEYLDAPRELTGEAGTNRAPSFITKQISADNDLQAVQSWLAEFKDSPQTHRTYRKEAERLLLWSLIEKQKMDDISTTLEQAVTDKQKLNIELAITNERLIKQDEIIIALKNQHEDRLKRVYEEKDILITQCNQLQNDIKSLQEKISSQAEQYQKSIAQQNSSHEQSENRWAKLIDQARDETKDGYKKLENIRAAHDIESKNLKVKLTELQQVSHERNAQLNVSVSQISQLKQDIKTLESEIIKTRSIIMKFEEEQKSKNIIILQSAKNNRKKEKIINID